MCLFWQTGLAAMCNCGCCLVAGDRGAREFLQKHGLSGAMAQKLVLKYSSSTEEAVRQDPYTCLTHASTSSTFRSTPSCPALLPDTIQLMRNSLNTGTSCSLLTASNALVTTNNVDRKVQHLQLARHHSSTFCVSCATFT